ncbi:MAG: cupin domain-containing protein [bacterium]
MINVIKVEDAPKIPNPHGVDARRLHDSSQAQVMHMALAPGETVAKHSVPVDVCFFIIEGSGIIEEGDERARVGADMLVYGAANTPHGIVNDGDSILRILVVRAPRP